MADYNFSEIEKKWQKYWEDNETFKTAEDPQFPKEKRLYILDMFPYPSGAGLHVGHPEGYTASDILCRFYRMNGFNVLHPIGFDSFGLPAENYAIKTGTHPRTSTEKNIENFRRQIKTLGFSYDWSREISTHHADYYKWTQWIFIQLFEKGLAYEANVPINWCNSCKTGLANEEVVNGNCERCGSPVIKRDMRQWMLKITAYADRLLKDLKDVDWPESIKTLQRNWIGKSTGAEVDFTVDGIGKTLKIFTTRPDTLFGATYMVVSPEHPLLFEMVSGEQKEAVEQYVHAASMKSDLERTDLSKDKTGVFTGAFAVNPVNNAKIPIWVSDYVLISYGTGAIMAVPAHDERDFEFAKKFELPIIQVVEKKKGEGAQEKLDEAYIAQGFAIHSGQFNGMSTEEFKTTITRWLEEKGIGKKAVNYKLRDWVFSRQRFWGEPMPLIHLEDGTTIAEDIKNLPLTLPEVESYQPTGTGESPLAAIEDWVNVTLPDGRKGKRETNTMPQWAGSCWYYLRYLDPKNENEFLSKEAMEYWMPVDLYIGGAEHAVLHLLYARFWHKFLYDCGLVNTKEPFMKLRNQGIILGENGEKMSKSRGNVVNPDDVIAEFGADSLRLYEMFMGPLDTMKPWNTSGTAGIFRFLSRVYKLYTTFEVTKEAPSNDIHKLLHKTIKKVTHDIETMNQFNTAIAAMMTLVNELYKLNSQSHQVLKTLCLLISPFAPHLGEELWEMLGYEPSVAYVPWPEYDEALTIDDTYVMVVSINGKVRDNIEMPRGSSKEQMMDAATSSEKAKKYTDGKEIVKIIAVPDKLVNIVVKG